MHSLGRYNNVYMGGKRTFDFDKAIGKATWIPGFVAFAVFAGVIGVSAYSSLSNQISADPAPATEPTTAKVAGSDCGAVIDADASGKQMASGYIRVAINNYWVPSGLASAAQHKSYNEKTANTPYKCNEISVKVPNAAKCLTDSENIKAIKTYVSEKQKLDYVDSVKEFEALTGDKMKKTIIGSSIKPKCLGGSESYEGLTDDRQVTDSKAVETAKGAAEGVLSGGEDIKVLTPKANPAVEKQVAQGQESSGGNTSGNTNTNGSSSIKDQYIVYLTKLNGIDRNRGNKSYTQDVEDEILRLKNVKNPTAKDLQGIKSLTKNISSDDKSIASAYEKYRATLKKLDAARGKTSYTQQVEDAIYSLVHKLNPTANDLTKIEILTDQVKQLNVTTRSKSISAARKGLGEAIGNIAGRSNGAIGGAIVGYGVSPIVGPAVGAIVGGRVGAQYGQRAGKAVDRTTGPTVKAISNLYWKAVGYEVKGARAVSGFIGGLVAGKYDKYLIRK